MRTVLFMLCAAALALASACSAGQRSVRTDPRKDDRGIEFRRLPEPQYAAPDNWIPVPLEGADEGMVAAVQLSRPELAGMMILSVVHADGMSPLGHAAKLRSQVTRLVPGMLASDAAESTEGAHEASFVWRGTDPPAAGAEPMRGKVLFRTLPGYPGFLVMCQGWWPETSHEFLISPLHRACESVAPK